MLASDFLEEQHVTYDKLKGAYPWITPTLSITTTIMQCTIPITVPMQIMINMQVTALKSFSDVFSFVWY